MKSYFKKTGLAAFAAIAFAASVFAGVETNVTGGLWQNLPIVGGAAYSCSTVNNNSVCTVPAGPSVVAGTETIPANSGLSGGQIPQNVLLSLNSLNALPILVQPVTTAVVPISASNLSGGVIYTSAATITSANITLPTAPIDGQQYRVSANRTITTLSVVAGGSASMGGNTAPTVLTASTTAPQGYVFRYNAADTSWYRIQ